MTDLDQYEAAYEDLAGDPDRWMSSAQNLLAAADRLWESVRADFDTQGKLSDDGGSHADVVQSPGPDRPFLQHAAVYLMIAGFAVENALKAVLLRCEQAAATQESRGVLRIANKLKTHDLRRLAREARISLEKAEYDLLDRLCAYLMWAGRYPVAATSRGQAAVQHIWDSDQQAIVRVFQKIESAFRGA